MRWTVAGMLLIILGAGSAALAQEDLDRVAAEQAMNQKVQRFIELGLEREAATLIAVLSETGMSPAEILLTMMMADRGGDEAGGIMLLMNAMKKASPAQPVVIDRVDQLLIVEGGRLYVIDLATMEVAGTLDYARAADADDEALWRWLVPIMAGEQRHERAGGEEAEVCRMHLKVLAGALHQYVLAHEALPGEAWVTEITPLLGEGRDALRCPARELGVAFALNEKLVGVALGAITEPGETILLVETALGDANPVGGPEALPEEAVHDGGVNVLFVSGEAEWLPLPEARELLALPIAR